MNGAASSVALALAVVLMVMAGPAASHKYFYSGTCPQLEALKDFDMNKFLGDWYVNQQTSSSARCLVNNYALNPDKPGTFKLEQSSVHQVLGLASKDGRWRYYGEVSPRENATGKGDLQVKYSLNPGTAKYTVLATDYDNFASIVSCQDLPIGYRISSSILSRKRTLDPKHLDQARSVQSKNGMEVELLSSLQQGEEECQPPKPGEGFHGAVQRAGDVINQGVQAVKDGAIKLYNKVRGGNGSAESMEAGSGANGNYTTVMGVNKDAEWLP